MNRLTIVIASCVLLLSCSAGKEKERRTGREAFTVEVMNKITPVKNQGSSTLCWAYAMLATIESDRLMQGDSVNLSVAYIGRAMLQEQAVGMYTRRGEDTVSLRGTMKTALGVMQRHGIMPYDAYRTDCNFSVVSRRVSALAEDAIRKRTGIAGLSENVARLLDETVNPLPPRVYMYGAEYTPGEFARSVCPDDAYMAFTSFTHLPMYEDVVLDVPDNRTHDAFRNIPVDSLINAMEAALRSGRSVCWEGDITEPGFSFAAGTARLQDESADCTQESRQRAFERFLTTDDHCMELIGIARDRHGRKYFVCKNSWGTDNPYGGLMFMSFNYARMKTVAAGFLGS